MIDINIRCYEFRGAVTPSPSKFQDLFCTDLKRQESVDFDSRITLTLIETVPKVCVAMLSEPKSRPAASRHVKRLDGTSIFQTKIMDSSVVRP